MGYAVARFTGTVDQNLLCSICSAVLEEAVLTPCGHSFCQMCLHTWIQARGAGPPTCPECRGRISLDQARPILSIRNLINGMDVHCEHRARGCRAVIKLEGHTSHLETCGYSPEECAGCGSSVNRCELAEHHMRCEAIAAALRDEDELLQAVVASGSFSNLSGSSASGTSQISVFNLGLPNQSARLSQSKANIRSNKYRYGTYTELAELSCRVAGLELQLRRMKRDLESAETKNRKLERELKRAKDELDESKRNKTVAIDRGSYVEFDPDYEYGFTASSVSRLSCLLARFLLRKPGYICRDRVFNAVKRCYDNFSRASDVQGAHHQGEHDVHMLVATAYASNWFSETQRLHFHLWLQAISRRRHFQHLSLAALRDITSTTTTSP